MTTEWGRHGFTQADIPHQAGKTYAITGANSGIGFEAARLLGKAGAEIILLCRNPEKASRAETKLREQASEGRYRTILIDLADLKNVHDAAYTLRQHCDGLDGLINNAGLNTVKPQKTAQGYELTWGVNVLGGFALAALVSDLVEKPSGRFVWLSSNFHRFVSKNPFNVERPDQEHQGVAAYNVSKLANLMLSLELQRQLTTAGKTATSYACHPGFAATNIVENGAGKMAALMVKPFEALIAQPPEKGALPTVLCAAAAEAAPGGYYGPKGFLHQNGPVGRETPSSLARDQQAAGQLWSLCSSQTETNWKIFR